MSAHFGLPAAICALGLALAPAAQGGTATEGPARAARIDTARIVAAESEPQNWLAHGRTYSEQRFSPLDSINRDTVGDLGLAFHVDLFTQRGVEATPIVVDGVMFLSGPWSVVWALDAATGAELWHFDPEVPRAWGQKACCDVVNRGVAVYEGKVIVGTLDGYLVALDAGTGQPIWRTDTLIDRTRPYTITGAPRVVNGRVFIGNGGAEYGVRGYFSAYDVETGALDWRFFTVPRDPALGQESPALERAEGSWTGRWWEIGGGGTVWDSFAYDPELDLLYVGTGNGSPWNRTVRSPEGGDNLYLSSILAVKPATGELIWHYQTTPADNWDYTATQHMILADIPVGGKTRKVLMQAPKNGFFYVLDRESGELLSADKYVLATWASHVDLMTGRPVENPATDLDPGTGRPILAADADYSREPKLVFPAPIGGHNWQPMAYSPRAGLVYIPVMELPGLFEPNPGFLYEPGLWNTGGRADLSRDGNPDFVAGRLLAWDPVRGRPVWTFEHWGAWNGGLLATAGDLVFQGGGDGFLRAHDAATGALLWQAPAGTGVVAPPITYAVNGEQHVAVAAGWGGAFALYAGRAAKAAGVTHEGRLLVFKLGGRQALPEPVDRPRHDPPPVQDVRAETIEEGTILYNQYCAVCHGFGAVSGGVLPDLRHSAPEVHAGWRAIVLEGTRADGGMASFADWLDPEDVEKIHAYVLKRAHEGDVPPELAGGE